MSDSAAPSNQPRASALQLTPSRIREVANAAMHRNDVTALWFGEPDLPTPDFIVDAGVAALRRGESKYSHNLGLSALRDTLARYLNALHQPMQPLTSDRIAVTSSGVSALMITAQMLLEPGDTAVVLTPHWPNIGEIPRLLSARLQTVPLELRGTRWELDLDRLLDAITPQVKVVWINSPNNPTGWTMAHAAQQAVLEKCRKLGVWLVSDEVYSRIYFAGDARQPVAPSFVELTHAEDRAVIVNSFSKAWAMTGWRLGWLVAPPGWEPTLANVIEYNTSCAAPFAQHAAIVAVEQGEPFVRASVERYRAARDLTHQILSTVPGLQVPLPEATFYNFFHIERERDSLTLAKRLLNDTAVGIAPGVAFGAHGEGHLRVCFASELGRLQDALERVARALRHR